MKLIVGLGNPGEKYRLNRHNAGFLVLEELKIQMSKSQITNHKQTPNNNFQLNKKLQSEVVKIGDVILAKPTTFMNKTGEAVSSLATYYKLPATNIYIIYDDLDIKLGEYKIVKGKGPREHKGLLSIYGAIGSKDFWHVRVGIENRESKSQITNNKSQTPEPGGSGRAKPNSQIQNSKQNTTHNTPSTKHIPGEAYVLQNFTEQEMAVVQDVVEEIANSLLELIKDNS